MPRTDPDNDGIYRFDNILVEPAAHRLERDGQTLSVEPKVYTVLLTLLRHAGEMVSKDALLDSVWGHHHVSTGVLNRVISQLRHALGDPSVQPRYIVTVHSLGYRFIGTLRDATAGDAAAGPPSPASTVGNASTGGVRLPYRRRFADGDQFLNFIDLQPCLNQLANWAALLPPGDRLRQAIFAVLQLEYTRLRESGMAPPTLVYHEAVLAALAGDRQAALVALAQSIDAGSCDELALRRDLAWRVLADDPDFHRQQQRLSGQPIDL
jgi:DNA-binding winged helix-turn-helix (wHTH) protein